MGINKIIIAGAFVLGLTKISYGQTKTGESHAGGGLMKGSAGTICNVCHKPFEVDCSAKVMPPCGRTVSAIAVKDTAINHPKGTPPLFKSKGASNSCIVCHGAMAGEYLTGTATCQVQNALHK